MHSCQKGSNGYNALHTAIHNCNQSRLCTIDILLIGKRLSAPLNPPYISVSNTWKQYPHILLPRCLCTYIYCCRGASVPNLLLPLYSCTPIYCCRGARVPHLLLWRCPCTPRLTEIVMNYFEM